MDNKIDPLIILASARKNSDTEKHLNIIFKNEKHTKIDLLDYLISPYNYSHNYPQADRFTDIIKYFLKHDHVVFATPVYWYSMSGLMKTFFDRFTDLVTIQKKTGRFLAGKNTFLFAVGADPLLPPGFEVPFILTSSYLQMKYRGSLYATINDTNLNFQHEQKLFIENIYNHSKNGAPGK